MTNKGNLVLEVRPNQLVAYGKLLVAFCDGFKSKKKNDDGDLIDDTDSEPSLYIHIQNADDKYAIAKRRVEIRRGRSGARASEEKIYAKAYDKYIQLKNAGGFVDEEKEFLKAKVAKLEAIASDKKEEVVVVKKESKEKKAKDLKAELTALGVEYKGNASKEALQELLVQNKE